MSGYASASQLVDRPGGHVLDLGTALGRTPVGLVDHPDFFDGLLAHPDVAAAALLTVADVAASRYADLGQAKRLAHVDPVVTTGRRPASLRGVLRLQRGLRPLRPVAVGHRRRAGRRGHDERRHQPRPEGRARRRRARRAAPPRRRCRRPPGTTPDQHHVERPVDLADRWIRGLAETPLLLRDVEQVATVTGVAIGQLLTGLPLGPGPGPTVFLRPTQRGLRPVPSEGEGTVRLAGATRLGAARRIARFATGLDVYAGPQGTSAWSFELPGGRLILFLTSSAWRGFSGEGSLLELLAAGQAEGDGRTVAGCLAWEQLIDPESLAHAASLDVDAVEAGLAWLAASGRVGFDLAERSWFHRDLPIDTDDALLRRNPRLAGARRLAESGAVSGGPTSWAVRSGDTSYDVALDGRLRCTCTWSASTRAHGALQAHPRRLLGDR